jgi:hypothetical protein
MLLTLIVVIVRIPPSLAHSRLLDLQCFSMFEEEKYKDVLYMYLQKWEMEKDEIGNTEGDVGHKSHGEIALTDHDLMITLVSRGLCV